ncbi:MAG: NusG domain II-containing protein [bacterium]
MTLGDKVLIFLLILINLGSVFFLGRMGKSKQVIIQVDQKVVGIYDLHAPAARRVVVQGPLGDSEVEIQGGKVRMLRSACPGKTCQKAGWISGQGQIICCVPNKVLIRISGDESDPSLHLDGIAQ